MSIKTISLMALALAALGACAQAPAVRQDALVIEADRLWATGNYR